MMDSSVRCYWQAFQVPGNAVVKCIHLTRMEGLCAVCVYACGYVSRFFSTIVHPIDVTLGRFIAEDP